MKKIGITGSSGILGKNLIKYLKQKNKYKIITYKYDILNKSKLNLWIKNNQFDVIIHLAALVPTFQVNKNYYLAKKINYQGTVNLVKSIKKFHDNKKLFLFFSSTSHVYNFSKNLIRENSALSGITKYGKTKIFAENYLKKNSKFYDLSIGRISSLVSNNQKKNFVLKNLISKGKIGEKIFFKNSNVKRNFIYVDDVSKIILKLISKKIKGTFNISSSEITSFFNMLDYLKKKYKFNIFHKKGFNNENLILSNKNPN